MTYTYDEALAASTEYFDGDELAAKVFVDKYAMRNENKEIVEETPLDMHGRIAEHLSRIERNKFKQPLSFKTIFDSINHFDRIVPQGGPMFGIGSPQFITLSNCYVVESPQDSYGSIMRADEHLVQISKRRGGCIEENESVYLEHKGLTSIKDVDIGDHVLSYNIHDNKSEFREILDKYYTDVEEGDRICIQLVNGFTIKTSKKHPLLTFNTQNNKYEYVKAGQIESGDLCIIPEDVDNNITAKVKQRIAVETIKQDTNSQRYIDISVEGNNNYYAGTNGLINIHNCGLDLSHLRPNETSTRNAAGSSTGPVCFARRFSHSIREVGQCSRRGALMLTMSIHHPDIIEYAESKQDLTQITGANISIRITDEFMNAVMEDKDYEQRWPIEGEPKIVKNVSARKVWNTIIKCAWNTAEPGLLFWDNIISESPADCYADVGFETNATNPCSELPLCPNDSCRLLLLNLFGYILDPFTAKAKFDFDAFYADTLIAQRYMDDIIDLELECIDKIIAKIHDDPEDIITKQVELELWLKIKHKCKQGRRTGLGQTGLGDTLAALGITYGSRKSINFTEKVYRYIKFGSYRASVEMAKELGPFPVWDWDKEKDNPFLLRFKDESIKVNGEIIEGYDLYNDFAEFGRRNIANLTTAPAGSVSLETRTTSSAEPAYFLSSKRRKKVNSSDEGTRVDEVDANGDNWMIFDVVHPKLQTWMDVTGETDIAKSPWYGCCAEDLDPYDRIKMLASAQQHIDHSISFTINLPNDVSQKSVAKIYEEGWRSGLKGVTVYRAGCRDGIITDAKSTPKSFVPEERPRNLPCDVHHTMCDGENYFVLVGLKDGQPHEVFAGRNGFLPPKIKTGQIVRKRKDYYMAKFDDTDLELSPITASTSEQQDIITRLVSLPLRTGVDMHVIVRQLEKAGEKGGMNSFNRGVARILKKYIPDGTEEHGEACPECGASPMIRQDGCPSCQSCGFSKCV